MAKIENGRWPLVIYEIPEFSTEPADVEIRNIHFHNPIEGAIVAQKCHNFTAKNNLITAETMEGRTSPFNEGFGIFVFGADPPENLPNPNNIYGRVIIQNNYVDLEQAPTTSPPTWTTLSIAVNSTVASIEIVRNHVLNDIRFGIFLINNEGGMMVKRNVVELGPEDLPLAESDFSYGILALGFGIPMNGNVQILKNTVVCNAKKQIGIGLHTFYGGDEIGTSSVILNNITLNDGFAGIGSGGRNNAYIGLNQIKGDSEHGIILGGYYPDACDAFFATDNNVIFGNIMWRLEASCSNVFFNECTSNNFLSFGHGTVFDNGENNKIIGRHWDILSGYCE